MLKRSIMIALLALLVGLSAAAAQDVTPVSEAATPISPSLAAQMTTLEATTAALRDLPIKQPVEHRFPTRQQTIDYLRATYARELPPEQIARTKDFYVTLGLLSPDIDLSEVYLNLLGSQVAGFYDPDTETMNVIPTIGDDPGTTLSFTEQVIYVHEFTHALQDQYFGLNALMNNPDVQNSPDRSLALTSLVEGDATAIMTVYEQNVTLRNPLAALGMLVEGLQAGNLFLPADVPSILTTELLLPYEEGLNFVVAVFKSGGWDAVNAAYANPPTTSEQILHPDKYLAGEGAQDVALDDASAALGDGWVDQWDTTAGEFYLREQLKTELPGDQANQAAAGWGGDHFRIYVDASGDLASALALKWDTPADQAEYEDAYRAYATARFGVAADANGCWQTDASTTCLVSGDGTRIVSAPTVELAQALLGM